MWMTSSQRGRQRQAQVFFGFKEAEDRKHRMVRAVEGEKKFHCTRCGRRSLCDRVPGVCHGPKRVKENNEIDIDTGHCWKDKIFGGHHVQSIVDVGKVRISIWCRR